MFNTIPYEKDATRVMEGMLQLGDGHFDLQHTRWAIHDGGVVGVIVRYPILREGGIDQKAGKGLAHTMGFCRCL